MKRFTKIATSLAIAVLLLATTALPLVACTKEPDNSDGGSNGGSGLGEDFALVFSSQELDKVFNPFFSTTAADSNVISPTQVSMLGNNSKGGYTYGDDEQVVTKDLEFYYDEKTDTTTYLFVLKNNVRFSNGSLLTIKDVLFNYYVYLDPAYTGSSTIYSTDIVGLKAYRTQQLSEADQDSFKQRFQEEATSRITALYYAVDDILSIASNKGGTEDEFIALLEQYKKDHTSDTYAHIVDDFKQAQVFFREELESDYTNAVDSYRDKKFKNDNGELIEGLFTTDVEMFLYNEGCISWNKKGNNGKGELTSTLTNDVSELKSWTKEKAIERVYNNKMPDSVGEVITGWATASTLYEYIVNDQMQTYFKQNERTVNNITGIKFANRTETVNVNGTDYPVPEYENGDIKEGSYEVLSITINKEDPKAIWNFGITIAPMYYYSTTNWNGKNYIEAFDFESNFGVEYGSQDFMTEVVKASSKIGVPVGAGPYAASRSSGGIENVTSGEFYDKGVVYYERNPYYFAGKAKIKSIRYKVVSESQMLNSLYSKDIHFAEPNAKPENKSELEGKKSDGFGVKMIQTSGYGYIGINAGKVPSIKVRQAIMHSINTQQCVDYYKSTAEAIYRSMSKSNWAYPTGCTAYYPYIGGAIPEDLDVVNPDYKDFIEYKREQVEGTPDANRYDAGKVLSTEEQKEFLLGLVQNNGYSNGAWTATENAGYINNGTVLQKSTDKLSYEFTIAGEETDHPAYMALFTAGELLNTIGFDITVRTDANALNKLSSGALTVWAAAWGSTIDPDMYQVYHMESQATSVLNWGYKQILGNQTKYSTEYGILVELSDLIERGRATSDQSVRAGIYRQALDLVMELAIELPTYQRNDLYAYNTNIIDESSFTPASELSAYKGLINNLNMLSLVK